MKIERNRIFRELDPPPGGAARLRARLAAATGRRRVEAWWLGPIAVAVLAVLAILVFGQPQVPDGGAGENSLMMAAEFDRLLGRESDPVVLSVTRGDEQLVVRELASREPLVRIFRLETQQSDASSAQDESP